MIRKLNFFENDKINLYPVNFVHVFAQKFFFGTERNEVHRSTKARGTSLPRKKN